MKLAFTGKNPVRLKPVVSGGGVGVAFSGLGPQSSYGMSHRVRGEKCRSDRLKMDNPDSY